MIRVSAKIFVETPPEDAFAFIINQQYLTAWQPGLLSSTPVSKGVAQAGSTFAQFMRNGEQIEAVTTKIILLEFPFKLIQVSSSPRLWFKRTWTLRVTGLGTEIMLAEERLLGGLWNMLMRSQREKHYRESIEEGCENLRKLLQLLGLKKSAA